MDVLGRDRAPFSGRVWQEIDAAVTGVKTANCTARRFLEVDGPYGLGLTSLSGDDDWLEPHDRGPSSREWGVPRTAPQQPPLEDPVGPEGRGTFLVQSPARSVPMIASEFLLGVRNVESFDDECQPLDLSRVVRAARDVALEEERLIYYGNQAADQPGLLEIDILHLQPALREVLRVAGLPNAERARIHRILTGLRHRSDFSAVQPFFAEFNLIAPQYLNRIYARIGYNLRNVMDLAPVAGADLDRLHDAVEALAERGYSGPYALAVSPSIYTRLHKLLPGTEITLAELIRDLFPRGIHMAPVIQGLAELPGYPYDLRRLGVIVNCARPYMRLVVGQDWCAAYRGMTGGGVYHRFAIVSSLRLEISEPSAKQILATQMPP